MHQDEPESSMHDVGQRIVQIEEPNIANDSVTNDDYKIAVEEVTDEDTDDVDIFVNENNDNLDFFSNEDNDNSDPSTNEACLEKINDEIMQPDNSLEDEESTTTRSGRVSRPHNCAIHFPETARYQADDVEGDGSQIKSFYYNKVEYWHALPGVMFQ